MQHGNIRNAHRPYLGQLANKFGEGLDTGFLSVRTVLNWTARRPLNFFQGCRCTAWSSCIGNVIWAADHAFALIQPWLVSAQTTCQKIRPRLVRPRVGAHIIAHNHYFWIKQTSSHLSTTKCSTQASGMRTYTMWAA